MKEKMTSAGFFGVFFITILGTLVIGLLAPTISFGLGYFAGWVLQITIGETVVNGLNLLFDTERFTVETLPLICATIGMIGGYFATNPTVKSMKEKIGEKGIKKLEDYRDNME